MIETERLLLRPYVLADHERYCALISEQRSDPVARAASGEDAWMHVQVLAGHWALLSYGIFAILDKESGDFIGETGLCQCRRGEVVDFDQADEASWILFASHRGRGLAHEAASAAHAWYATNRGAFRTVCLIRPENTRSLSLAAKLGYRVLRPIVHKIEDLLLHERVPD